MRRELLGRDDAAAARDDSADGSPVVRGPRAGPAEEEGVQRRQRVVALALRWWARVAVVVEERILVNSRRDGQVLLAPRYLLGRHGDDDAVAYPVIAPFEIVLLSHGPVDASGGAVPPPPPVEPRPAFAGAAAGSIPQQLDRVALGQLAWRRYLARLIDFVLFAMFSGAILSMAFPEQAKTWAEEGNLWLGVVIALAYVPLEAWMLASSGSTPGKRLFAMQVRRRDGSPLDYTTALQRSGWVFVLGQACGAPILTWVVKLLAFGRFQRTGTTLWDQRVGTQVVYGTMTEGRRFAAAALIGLYLALMYLVASSALA